MNECDAMNSLGEMQCVLAASPQALLFSRCPFPDLRIIPSDISRKNLVCLIRMIRVLWKEKPDIVVTHSSTDSWLFQLARMFCYRNIRCVRVRHVSAGIKPNLATKWMYQRFDAVITTSDVIRSNVIKVGVSEHCVFSIPTGLDTDLWALRSKDEYCVQRSELMAWTNCFSSTYIISMVSTLRSWKGHEYAIRAIATIDDVFLNVIGDGPQEARLRKLVKSLNLENRVKFWGYQENVRSYLQASDLFLQPSIANEGVSQSLLQAQAVGVPVIASDISGLNQVVVHDQTGYLITPESEESLKNAILAIKDGHHQTERWVNEARKNICRYGSLEVMVNKASEVYDFVMKKASQC